MLLRVNEKHQSTQRCQFNAVTHLWHDQSINSVSFITFSNFIS